MQSVYQIKQEMCEIGRRLYNRGFAAANDGNITYRISDSEVLCTPTLICKGFMKPDDICSVDMEGKQLSGKRKRTSEVLLHLAIMKERPDVKSCVHCHPPHATAFAIAREPIPQCVLPEVEVFLGEVPLAKYETPGGQKFADTVLPYCRKSNVIILTNHGTVSFGESLERAYWWTEILDAYCRMLILARDLGRVSYLSEGQTRELLDLKAKWGFKDPRNEAEMKDCDICANDLFRSSWADSGVQERAFVPPSKSASAGALKSGDPAASKPAAGNNGAPHDQEALVQMITDRVMAALAARS